MEEHGGDQPPPLMPIEDGGAEACAEAVLRLTDQAPQYGQASPFPDSSEREPAHAEHENVGDKQGSSDGRFVLAEDSGKFFAERGEGETQAGAAFVAARGADADECATNGTKLRAGLLLAAAVEESAQRVFPSLDSPLPAVRKRQPSSLRHARCVSIIQKSRQMSRRAEARDGTVRRVWEAHRRGSGEAQAHEKL